MNINIYLLLIWLTAILIASLDLVIVIGSKNLASRCFALLSFITAIWVTSQGFLIYTNSYVFADFLIRFQYVIGISIAMGFYLFSTIYPDDKKPNTKSIIYTIIVISIFTYLYLFTSYMNTGVIEIGGKGHWAWTFGPLNILFNIIFSGIWFIALLKLYKSYLKESGTLKINLRNMFWALTLGIIPPTLANIILPTFGIYSFNWVGPISSSIWIFIISYSILKYQQMNVKAVSAEVLAIAMTIILFINIFVDISSDIWISITTFITFILLAFYLIKTVLNEAKQTEQLKDLTLNLSSKVAEQTVEIRKSYDLEKIARRELEKLNEAKDQFIMITQHALRTPVTIIDNSLEMVVTGTVKNKLGDADQVKTLNGAQKAVKRLQKIVDDFLSITAIKSSSKILDLGSINLKTVIEDILPELQLYIENKKISVEYSRDEKDWPTLTLDASKMREALLIIIENAIRYNVDNGKIIIKSKLAGEIFELSISDTGSGIKSNDKEKIFGHLFHRGDNAKIVNPTGMGIGLSVAKAIVCAHHGDLKIDSDGEGLGTKVTISIPVNGFTLSV
jgi:signal transduction histidine kinase